MSYTSCHKSSTCFFFSERQLYLSLKKKRRHTESLTDSKHSIAKSNLVPDDKIATTAVNMMIICFFDKDTKQLHSETVCAYAMSGAHECRRPERASNGGSKCSAECTQCPNTANLLMLSQFCHNSGLATDFGLFNVISKHSDAGVYQ